ncbi:MAG: DUF3891 family protein [Chloroflexota bacterium]
MFQSKTRNIIIPQSEHARLAGTIAYHWGNTATAATPIDKTAFAAGVTLHDRGYGLIDTMGIGTTDESVWLMTQQRGIHTPEADPVIDTVALMHIRRLLSHSDEADAQAFIQLADERIAHNIAQTAHTHDEFVQADRVTELCDNISFKFCFEELAQFTGNVGATDNLQPIQVQIKPRGVIHLNPWPLNVAEVQGFILGYQAAGYPDHLQPILVEYAITPQVEG